MTGLPSFQVLLDLAEGVDVPLPAALRTLYGRLCLPARQDRPYVIANLVSTLDGVVSLKEPRDSGGSEISGGNAHDRALMGILRAVADAVIVGAGTLRAVPNHRWTPEKIYSPYANAYQELRRQLGKTEAPWNVIVSARGRLDLTRPVFQDPRIQTLVITSSDGERALSHQVLPDSLRVVSISEPTFSARSILDAISQVAMANIILVEGGPRLLDAFVAENVLNEQFLAIAPQLAGRRVDDGRPGLVVGHHFAPNNPRWGKLISVRRASDHLFLRYVFA